MRVSASTIEQVFPNLGAVKYCILHQNCDEFQAHPFARCRLELLEGDLADDPVAHVAQASGGVVPGQLGDRLGSRAVGRSRPLNHQRSG
jgi:hypothetical protein